MKINSKTQLSGKSSPKVTIIVLFYNAAKVTLECLAAVEKYTNYNPLEIILVDNGSGFEEKKELKKGLANFKNLEVKLIANSENLGFAQAANLAASKAKGEILVFLNNDVIVTANWLKPLVLYLLKNDKVAACQPKIRSFVKKDYFDYAGGAGGFLDIFGYSFTRGRVFDSIEKDVGQYDRPCEILWASGSCLVIKTEAFLNLGGFDEYFFSYMEEIDLAIKLAEKGYRIYSVPQSLVYHYGAYTSNKNLPFKIYLNHRNHLYLVLKHYSIWPYLPIILACFLFEIGAVFYYFFSLRFSFISSVFKADVEIVFKLPHFAKIGIITWSGRTLLRLKNIYSGSVVVSYFIYGKKSFSQLMKYKSKRKKEFKKYVDVTFLSKS